MSDKQRNFPVVLLFFCLLPRLAAGQGSIGPLQRLEEFGVSVFRGASVASFLRAGDLAYFTVDGAYTSEWLWRSDGTAEGTFPLAETGGLLTPGLDFWTVEGSTVYFTSPGSSPRGPFRSLWRSDGSVEGTIPLATQELIYAVDQPGEAPRTALPVPETGLVFFSAANEAGYELWATDGTPEGTGLVEDINPNGSSNPSFMATLDGELFFLADLAQGKELWRSDGTPEGTERVESLHHLGGGVVTLARAGDLLFLLGQTASGVEVWRSDGTEAGTTKALFLQSTQLLGHAAADGRFFLAVHNQIAQEKELWSVPDDYTFASRLLETTAQGSFDMLALGGGAVFSLSEEGYGLEPWWSDGTPEGTRRIADVCTGPCGSSPVFVGVHAGRVLFTAEDGGHGREPWVTEGTFVRPVGDLCPGTCGSDLRQSGEVNGWLVLLTGDQLWMFDGSPAGAFPLARFLEGSIRTIILPLSDRLLVSTESTFFKGTLWSLPVTAPVPPEVLPGQWLASPQVPGFRFKAVIEGQSFSQQSAKCLPRTLCAMGGPRGIAEVFLRVSGPRPDGSVWPAAVKLTTAPVDVWIHQVSTGYVRHHRLERADPASPVLPGILDRGFFPANPLVPLFSVEKAAAPRPPSGPWVSYKSIKGYRVKARYASGGKLRTMRMETCLPGTFCLSGAVKGLTDLLVRLNPQPDGDVSPRVARFIPARVEVWIEQTKTGAVRYYRLDPVPAGSLALNGYVDWEGFRKSSRR